MRYFLYTYSLPGNFISSKRAGVFGAPKNHAGLTTKFLKLRRGDLILIRDGNKRRLEFFGYCEVVGQPFDHDEYSPFKDFLWPDEEAAKKVFYPLRLAVDFVSVPKLKLEVITWSALDALGFEGTNWFRMEGKQAWAKKLTGNFIEAPTEVDAFSKLIGLSENWF